MPIGAPPALPPRSARGDDRAPGSTLDRTCSLGATLTLAALVLLAIGYPAAHAVSSIVRWLGAGNRVGAVDAAMIGLGPARLLLISVGYATLIGVLATAAAWPVAWAMRGWDSLAPTPRRRRTAMLAVPLLLPSYLAYAGWGLIRAPRTLIGDWINQWPDVSLLAGQIIAILGLTLWVWPLSALILAAGVRRVPQSLLDALALDAGRAWRAPLTRLRLILPALLASTGLIALVMLDSAVPLDAAQIDTYAIHLLRLLNLVHEVDAVWIASWPLILIAVVAGLLVTTRLDRWAAHGYTGDSDGALPGTRRSRAPIGATVLLWTASVVAPFLLFVYNLRQPPSGPTFEAASRLLSNFWRDSGAAIAASLRTSAWVGLAGAAVTGATWFGLSELGGTRRSPLARGAARWSLRLLLIAALIPGVLVGSVTDKAWNAYGWSRWVADSSIIVVLAHLARFGFLGGLVGWWLARLEPPQQRDLRLIDGADTVRGWLAVCVAPHSGALLGAALAIGALSFHEIECTVLLQVPGVESLAQQVLEHLHYARDDRLAAAAVSLLAAGVAVAYAAAALLSLGTGRDASDTTRSRPSPAPYAPVG